MERDKRASSWGGRAWILVVNRLVVVLSGAGAGAGPGWCAGWVELVQSGSQGLLAGWLE